jgi:hypothetical protein
MQQIQEVNSVKIYYEILLYKIHNRHKHAYKVKVKLSLYQAMEAQRVVRC